MIFEQKNRSDLQQLISNKMTKIDEKIFKAYDVRGSYPAQLNGEIAYKIGVSYAKKVQPETVVVGKDIRQASDDIYENLIRGLIDQGIDVKAAGRMTNPMIGFAVWKYNFDGGLIASASHNPIGYGGVKMMEKGAVSIGGVDPEIKGGVLGGDFTPKTEKGKVEEFDVKKDYLDFLKSFVKDENLKRIKIFADPLFGSVGLIIKELIKDLPFEVILNNAEPSSKFGGLPEPNPLNPEVRRSSIEAFKKSGCDFGVIWDGDGDRCFFLDEKGNFIDAPYITSLLCEYILKSHPRSKIICDPRIIWPIEKAVKENGGEFYTVKSGYKFIKEKMAEIGGQFGAEMTAHYFFKENMNSDNGIIPFLMVAQIVAESGKKLSELIAPYQQGHVMMEEIKFPVEDPSELIAKIKKEYKDASQNELDGLSVETNEIRFNLRASNTESVAKLNMEAKSQEILSREKEKLLKIING